MTNIDNMEKKVGEDLVFSDKSTLNDERKYVVVIKEHQRIVVVDKLKETESQKRYYERNKDKILKKNMEYEKTRYHNDEEFRIRRNRQKMESYYRRKEAKKKEKNNNNDESMEKN